MTATDHRIIYEIFLWVPQAQENEPHGTRGIYRYISRFFPDFCQQAPDNWWYGFNDPAVQLRISVSVDGINTALLT